MHLSKNTVELDLERQGPSPALYDNRRETVNGVILTLHNDTPQVNEYTVSVEVDSPLWQEDWFRLDALSVGAGAANGPPPGKSDLQLSDRECRLFVPVGARRELLIGFHVPKRPEARANRYTFRVIVQTAVSGTAVPPEVTGTVIIPPFYDWDMRVDMADPRLDGDKLRQGLRPQVARRLRPRVHYEVVITSRSNDWLYCDLELPEAPAEYLLTAFTERVAVPPPDAAKSLQVSRTHAGAVGDASRHLPLGAVTRLKALRGDPIEQKLPITARRINAPSVAPPDGNLHGAVVERVPADPPVKALDGKIVYVPRIPTRIADIPKRVFGSVRQAMAFFLMLFMFVSLVTLMRRAYTIDFKHVEILKYDDKSAVVEAKGARAAKIQLWKDDPPTDLSGSVQSHPASLRDIKSRRHVKDLANVVNVAFTSPLVPGSYHLILQDKWLPFPFLSSDPIPFKIVGPPQKPESVAQLEHPETAYHPGDLIRISGISDPKKFEGVKAGDQTLLSRLENTDVVATLPKTLPPNTYSISLVYSDRPENAGTLNVIARETPKGIKTGGASTGGASTGGPPKLVAEPSGNVASSDAHPGGEIKIVGKNLGHHGQVVIEGCAAVNARIWKPIYITAFVPRNITPGPHAVTFRIGGKDHNAGSITIPLPPPPSVTDDLLGNKSADVLAQTAKQQVTPFNSAAVSCLRAGDLDAINQAFDQVQEALKSDPNPKDQAALYYATARMYQRNNLGTNPVAQEAYRRAKAAAIKSHIILPPLSSPDR